MKYQELEQYDFKLPQELIAQHPAKPRDKARLLVYSRKSKQSKNSVFLDLTKHLAKNSLLVLNDTRVIPARIEARRHSGGKVILLFLQEVESSIYKVLLSRQIKTGEELILRGGLKAKVIRQQTKYFFIKTGLNYPHMLYHLEKYGQMPVPHYLKTTHPERSLRRDYQTVFAKTHGSVAAPTASLHFSKRLLKKLLRQGFEYCFITLHVGLGTFAPLDKENFHKRKLHREIYEVNPDVWEKIKTAKHQGRSIVAVGTTVVRTLETVARQSGVSKFFGETELFIQPGFDFKVVDALITNFHLPKTSLLLLVSAFIGDRSETLSLYRLAIKEKYRFYSFGDAMLIL